MEIFLIINFTQEQTWQFGENPLSKFDSKLRKINSFSIDHKRSNRADPLTDTINLFFSGEVSVPSFVHSHQISTAEEPSNPWEQLRHFFLPHNRRQTIPLQVPLPGCHHDLQELTLSGDDMSFGKKLFNLSANYLFTRELILSQFDW